MNFIGAEKVDKVSLTTYSTLITFSLPMNDPASADGEAPAYYLCSMQRVNGHTRWVHQGREPGMSLSTFSRLLPEWLQICILAVLLVLSGLFSGLNLGKFNTLLLPSCNHLH